MFLDVFNIEDADEAKGYLKFWCDLVIESAIQPFIMFVNLIKSHWFGIINYFDTKLNNGILEGINSKIQLAKKRARGFRKNFVNYIVGFVVKKSMQTDYNIQVMRKNKSFADRIVEISRMASMF